jgi:hypothetical protein
MLSVGNIIFCLTGIEPGTSVSSLEDRVLKTNVHFIIEFHGSVQNTELSLINGFVDIKIMNVWLRSTKLPA